MLATVVRITGSSYGGVGTRMVIRQQGPPIGIVSGGCLESDLAEHAKHVHESHRPRVVTYDTRGHGTSPARSGERGGGRTPAWSAGGTGAANATTR